MLKSDGTNTNYVVSGIMRKMLWDASHINTKNIVGKILTIVDAISENETRRKAIHDLAQQAIWDNYKDLGCEINFFCDCLADEVGEKRDEPQGIPCGRNTIFHVNN